MFIETDTIIKNGIAVYVPPINAKEMGATLTITIQYSESNPNLSWRENCPAPTVNIFYARDVIKHSGNIFITKDLNLVNGFYIITITAELLSNSVLSGTEIYSIIEDKGLIIGFPYSIFPPIPLYRA
jgi:hypothetical protein